MWTLPPPLGDTGQVSRALGTAMPPQGTQGSRVLTGQHQVDLVQELFKSKVPKRTQPPGLPWRGIPVNPRTPNRTQGPRPHELLALEPSVTTGSL